MWTLKNYRKNCRSVIGKKRNVGSSTFKIEIDSKIEGYDHIKLYGSISPEWVKPLCDSAHAIGFRVGGHVPMGMNVFDVAEAGYDDISHMVPLMVGMYCHV